MQAILDNLQLIMLICVILVVGVSQLNRLLGSLLGIGLWTAVLVVGDHGYSTGGAMGFTESLQFSRTSFYGLCAMLIAVHIWMAYAAYRRKPNRSS